jgi:hypothetical protein
MSLYGRTDINRAHDWLNHLLEPGKPGDQGNRQYSQPWYGLATEKPGVLESDEKGL